MGVVIQRFDVVLAELDPAVGSEIRKTRPCLVISPNEMNRQVDTIIIAPMTSGGHPYVFRVACRFQGRVGHVVLDQLRTIDRSRVVKKLGRLDRRTCETVLVKLQEFFDP